MSVSLSSIDKLLKIKYASEVAKDVNTKVSPWHEQIKSNGLTAGGKYYLQPIQLGINGGVGFSDETALPTPGTALIDELKVDTKNVYGVFNITKKSLEVNNTPEKIVNLLTREMSDLVDSVRWNLSRTLEMSHTGILATVDGAVSASSSVVLDSVQFILPGLNVSFYNGSTLVDSARIINVARSTKTITLNKSVTLADECSMTVYKSLNKELTGLDDIISTTGSIYNLNRATYGGLIPYTKTVTTITDGAILSAINECEDNHNITIDFIRASSDVIGYYLAYKQANNLNVTPLEIKGGYKTISFNGSIPIVKSKFAPAGTMDFLDSKTFQMYNLGKGEFDSETGSILVRDAGSASYTGLYTLFTEQYCRCPGGQGRISGITG